MKFFDVCGENRAWAGVFFVGDPFVGYLRILIRFSSGPL
jgi:hypothetical protein